MKNWIIIIILKIGFGFTLSSNTSNTIQEIRDDFEGVFEEANQIAIRSNVN